MQKGCYEEVGAMKIHREGKKPAEAAENYIRKTVTALMASLLFLVSVLTGCGGGSSGVSSSASSGVSSAGGNSAAGTAVTVSSEEDSPGGASEDSGSTEKELTLMIYLCGSDLESKAGAASADLDEIIASGINTDQVNVAVIAGGTTKWRNGFSDEETAVYTIGPGSQWEKKKNFTSVVQEGAPANMGEADTLKSFLDYSYKEYPAQNYALIMWDHGGGPMRGLCWDTAWAKDNLTMEEFTGALAESPFAEEKLSWIGFDACLMSSVETAYLVTPYAKYMIASEETEPSMGWSYDFLDGIEKDADGGETGRRIVDSFMDAGQEAGHEAALTLACMDLSQTEDVEEKLNSFFGKLGSSLSKDSFSELSNLREDTREFGKAMNDSQRLDLVDLGDLVSHYAGEAPEEAEALSDALRKMVIYSRSSLENCNGLSAYHPYYNKAYYEKVWREEYDTFAFAPSYTEYINTFADIWMGDAMGDWTQMNQLQSAGMTGETQYFSVQLTPEQMQYYASGQLLVLTQAGSENDSLSGVGYAQVYATDQVTIDDNGVLTAGYNGRTLYAVDDKGKVIAGPLGYSISDDGNLQIEINFINRESGAEHSLTHAMFECADAASGTDLPVLEEYVYDEDTEVWSNRLALARDDYQQMILLHDYRRPTYDGETMKAYSEWEDSSWAGGYEVELPVDFHFRFYDRLMDSLTLFACFQISDTQANLYGTELMQVENPSITKIRFRGGQDEDGSTNTGEGGRQYVYENEYWRMTINGQVEDAELSKSMELELLFENHSDQTLAANIPNNVVTVNGKQLCVREKGGFYNYELAPGSSDYATISFGPDDLAGLTEIHEISMDIECKVNNQEDTDASNLDTGAEDSSENTASDDGAGPGSAEPEEKNVNAQIVLHPIDLNLKNVAAKYDLSSPLSSCSKGNIDWSIVSIEPDGNKYYRIIVHCKNTGEEAVELPRHSLAAINGAVVECYARSGIDPLVLGPGVECYLSYNAYRRSYETSYFDHVGGSEHLMVSDIMNYFNVKEVSTLSLLPSSYVFHWNSPEEGRKESIVDFTFSKPISLTQTDEPVRSSDLEDPEEDRKDDAGGEMTKALDSGGSLPERTLLYSKDGVSVSGEYILVGDRKILMSAVIENESPDDTVLRFYDYMVNPGDHPDLKSYGMDNFEILASQRRRIFLEYLCQDEIESDEIKNFYMCIWQDGKELPSVHEIVLTFAEGAAFNKDGGITVPFSDTAPAVVDLTQDVSDDPPFASSIECPENAASCRREFSWTLPDTLTEEERSGIKAVEVGIMCEYTEELNRLEAEKAAGKAAEGSTEAGADDTDTAQAAEDAGSAETAETAAEAEGSEAALAEDKVAILPISWTTLQKEADADSKKDVYTGSWSGLVCVPESNPDVIIPMSEKPGTENEITYSKWDNSSLFDSVLIPMPQLHNYYYNPGFDLTLKVKSKTGTKSQASLDSFSINDTQGEGSRNKWPTAWFESVAFNNTATVLARDDQNVLKNVSGGYYGIDAAEAELSTEKGPISLKLIPVSEFDGDIVLIYSITFDDDSSRYYYGGPMQ